MSEARLYIKQCASGQVRARIRLESQPVPPRRVAGRYALSKEQNLQTDENSGEVVRKAKTIRLEAKRRIMEYAAAIERTYTKSRCVFLTGTLPGSSIASIEVFSRWQKSIQRRVRQWLADLCASSVAAVIVWEYQKRGALHVHLLVGCENLQQARAIRRSWRRYWVGLLQRITAESGQDMFEKSDGSSWRMTPHVVRAWAQPVRKSVSGYLAKYLSKSKPETIPATAYEPSRLWGATAKARSLCAMYTNTVRTVALPLQNVTAMFDKVAAYSAAAAVPLFSWTRRFSFSERGLAACFTWESQLEAMSTFTEMLGDTLAPVVKLQVQSRINAPSLTSPEAARLVFSGKLISGVPPDWLKT